MLLRPLGCVLQVGKTHIQTECFNFSRIILVHFFSSLNDALQVYMFVGVVQCLSKDVRTVIGSIILPAVITACI